MRINQVNGISFLFTIGFLLLFSSSFLAYLAWEGPGYQGSAAALEAPVMPPSLDSATPVPPPVSVEPAPSAGVLETPAEPPAPTEEKRAEPEPLNQETPKKTSGQAKPLDAPKAAKPVEPVTPPAAPKPVQKMEQKAPREVAKASQANPEQKVKSSRKARAKKPTHQEESADITRVPPEWDWFSKPLRMEIQQGKVQILGDASDPMAPGEATHEAKASEPSESIASSVPSQEEQTPVVIPPAEPSEIPSPERAETPESAPKQVVAESERSDRLVSALARLQARHDRRDREADEKALVLPSKGGDAKHVPASLIRLMNALKALRSDSPEAPVNDAIPSESTPLAEEPEKDVRETQGNSPETLTLRLN
ncbi:MAG TPA: hypothetical protein PLP29_16765 [Candidatus Ozemobacteraceae bacterium]|nr:hypothetical protein [Candidatus Ozemobacteraceae bacterium]